MAAVASYSGTLLQEQTQERALTCGQWAMLHQAGTTEPDGHIRLRLGNSRDASLLEEALQNSHIQVGDQTAILSIANPSLMNLPGRISGDQDGVPLPAGAGVPCRK